jgi:hypothetical protein
VKASRILSVLLIAALACSVAFAQGAKDKEKIAAESAQAWLKIIDGGDYGGSWDEASAHFKSQITRDKWIDAMKQYREKLGTVQSRNLKSANYTKVLPKAPEGEYVILQFESSFDGMDHAIETVIPMLDKDGKWRASGYFIKPAGM